MNAAKDLLKGLSVNWFDLLTLIVLFVGLLRGRKRGMSEELFDVFGWLLFVFVSAHFYKMAGGFLARIMPISLMWAYLLGYLSLVLVLSLIFAILKRVVGEKLVGSDLFGRLEYYLGMLAGMLRFFCILLVVMSVVHAKQFTPEELLKEKQEQEKDFGTITLPTWGSLQQDIFKDSATGKFVMKNLSDQLLASTLYETRFAPVESLGQKTEKDVDDIMNKGKPKK